MEEINQPLTRQCKPDKISQLECWSCPRACLDSLTGALTAVAAQQDDTAVVEGPTGVEISLLHQAVGLQCPVGLARREGETGGGSEVTAAQQEPTLSVARSVTRQVRDDTLQTPTSILL